MASPRKFLFETEFETRQPGNVAGGIAFTKAQRQLFEEEVRQAHENGRQEGENAVRKSIDADIAEALACLARSTKAAHDTFMQKIIDLENNAVALAVATANKLAGELIKGEPAASIEALFEDAVSHLQVMPHIVVQVPESLAPGIESRLAAIAENHGYAGKLVVAGDPELAKGDCHIEWDDGGLSKSMEQIRRAVVDTIECYLAARNGYFKDLDLDLLEKSAEAQVNATSGADAGKSARTDIERSSDVLSAVSGEGL